MAAPLDALRKEGVAAAQAGQAERARDLLLRVVQADQNDVQAWYWLSRVVQAPHEREICLENVLALDPGHTAVQAELAALRRERAEAEATLLSKEAIAAAVPRTAEEELISDAAVEPLACPYCGRVGPVEARQCPHCGGALVERRPKSKGHSIYSFGLVVVWLALANWTWLGVVLVYLFAGFLQNASGALSTLEALSSLLAGEGAAAPGIALPPDFPLLIVLLAGGGLFLFSLFVAWGLYRRYRFFYWLTIVLVILIFLSAAVRAATAENVSLWGLAAQLGAFLLAISFAFMAHDEFTWVDQRLDASLDRDVNSHSALYSRGQQHAGRGMWAKAAAHYAKAVALSPGHPDYRVALASACLHLDQPQRAREHLAEAQRIEPDHPQLAELWAALD